MDANVLVVAALLLWSNALLPLLCIPLIQRGVGPNPVLGLRTKKTLSDERIWYEANAYCGRGMLRASLVNTAALVLSLLVPGIRGNPAVFALGNALLMLVSILAVTIASLRYLRTL